MQVRKLPKVNADEHVRLQAASISGKDSERKPVKQAAIAAEAILQDERFAAMFEDPAFSIDVHSKEYQELHPSACAFSTLTMYQFLQQSVSRITPEGLLASALTNVIDVHGKDCDSCA
jgi:hypothetical protein